MGSQFPLTAKIEPFDSFWEAPENIEKGYRTFYQFYKHNYLKYLPTDKNAHVLAVSCGPGYFVNLLPKKATRMCWALTPFPRKWPMPRSGI